MQNGVRLQRIVRKARSFGNRYVNLRHRVSKEGVFFFSERRVGRESRSEPRCVSVVLFSPLPEPSVRL